MLANDLGLHVAPSQGPPVPTEYNRPPIADDEYIAPH